jgi:O-antigen/teichoic acid export membrane protein
LFNKLFNRIISLKLVLLLAFFVLISGFMFVFYPTNYWHLILLLAFCQSILSLNFYLRSCLTGLGFYRFDSIVSSADRFFLIFICGAFLYVPALQKNFNIEKFVYAQIFTQSLTAFIIILKLRSKIFAFQFNFKWQNAWLILKQSFPFSLSVILMSLYTKTDVVMLERHLPDGAKQAGIYASAYRLLDAVNILGLLFANLALPMFSQMRREKKDMLPLLKLSVQIILFISVSFVAAVVVHRHFIMHALYKEANEQSENVLGLLMLSFIAFCLSYVISTYLNAMSLTKRANKVYAMALILSITTNILIIPRFKSEGTAFVTLMTQFFVLFALWYFAWQNLKPKSQFVWFAKLVVFCITAFGIQWSINYSCRDTLSAIFQMFIGGLLSFIIGAALEIIPVRELWLRLK